MELSLMIVLACQLKIEPKQGEFIQVFCQLTLPTHVQYKCKPPLGCHITPPNTHLPLIKRVRSQTITFTLVRKIKESSCIYWVTSLYKCTLFVFKNDYSRLGTNIFENVRRRIHLLINKFRGGREI